MLTVAARCVVDAALEACGIAHPVPAFSASWRPNDSESNTATKDRTITEAALRERLLPSNSTRGVGTLLSVDLPFDARVSLTAG